METWTITSLAELKDFASDQLTKYAAEDARPVVLALSGDLGTGKTTFVQQIAHTLGVTETVTSPTFVVMKTYETTDATFAKLVHIDAYRIETLDEMRVLGFEALLREKDTIICIEWAERIADLLPANTISLQFTNQPDESRTITQS